MTYPDDFPPPHIPDPPTLPPGGPRTTTLTVPRRPDTRPGDIITVTLSPCCGLLPGDVCDCAAQAASALTAPVIGGWPR